MYFLSHHSCISVFWAPALQYFKPSHPDQQLKQHGSCSQVFPSNQSLETSILCHKIVRSISLSQVERFHWDFAPQRVEIFQHQGKIWLRPTSPLGLIVLFFHPPLDSFGTENVKVEKSLIIFLFNGWYLSIISLQRCNTCVVESNTSEVTWHWQFQSWECRFATAVANQATTTIPPECRRIQPAPPISSS